MQATSRHNISAVRLGSGINS